MLGRAGCQRVRMLSPAEAAIQTSWVRRGQPIGYRTAALTAWIGHSGSRLRPFAGLPTNGSVGWFAEVPPRAAERPNRAHHGHPAEPGERSEPDIQAGAPSDGDGWIAAIRKATNKPPASTHRGHSREPPGRSEADLREKQQSVRKENGCDQRCSII